MNRVRVNQLFYYYDFIKILAIQVHRLRGLKKKWNINLNTSAHIKI